MRTRNTFWALVAVYLLHAIVRFFDMPSGILATHFGLDGSANGWMSSNSFLVFHCFMAVFIIGVRWFIAATARWQNGINMPSGYYELSISQKQAFVSTMEHHSWNFGCLIIGLFIAIDGLILLANTNVPPSLPLVLGLVLTMVFLGGMGWWTITLLSAIQRIKKQNL